MIPALPSRQNMLAMLAGMTRAWGAVLFIEPVWPGLVLVAAVAAVPAVALAGFTGLGAALLTARLLALTVPGDAHRVNGLLAGLYLGAVYEFGLPLLVWIAVAASFATLATPVLAGLAWRIGKLPVLSLPFVLAIWFVRPLIAAAEPLLALHPVSVAAGDGSVFVPWLDSFFSALGMLLLSPGPGVGALIFAALALASRYLALLALLGYGAGLVTLAALGRADLQPLSFNFMLTAMALGGLFTVPGWASAAVALAAAALAAAFTVALDRLLQPLQAPLLTLPFVLGVWFWLAALGARRSGCRPVLTLDNPDTPERAYEQARLAEARGASLASVPLAPPFFGEWRVSQGFNGRHTHRDAWRHALDFHIVEAGSSFTGGGTRPGDFFCFGAPVLAPAAGQVVRARDDLPDMPPGEADLANNWGNYLLLRMASGHCVLLAHLKQGSLAARAGEWVAVGQVLAACGSSGRSPEPHLHLHVQAGDALGSPTCAFHLANVLVPQAGGRRHFLLNHVPREDGRVAAAPPDPDLAGALHWPVGRALRYRWRENGAAGARLAVLHSETTLLGQTRLRSDRGASAAFEATPSAIGLYQRHGARDPMLDLWMLALGLTPLSSVTESWNDRPSARLLPLGWAARALVATFRLLASGCDSRYTRAWNGPGRGWRQRGEHRLHLFPGVQLRAITEAWIVPGLGVARLRLEMSGQRQEAELESAGWMTDDGGLRWETRVDLPALRQEVAAGTRDAGPGENAIVDLNQRRRVS